MVSKALNQLRQMIAGMSGDCERKVTEILKLITYSSLNRANKYKIAAIMEQVKRESKRSKQM